MDRTESFKRWLAKNGTRFPKTMVDALLHGQWSSLVPDLTLEDGISDPLFYSLDPPYPDFRYDVMSAIDLWENLGLRRVKGHLLVMGQDLDGEDTYTSMCNYGDDGWLVMPHQWHLLKENERCARCNALVTVPLADKIVLSARACSDDVISLDAALAYLHPRGSYHPKMLC
jgi:hypothetical protein